MFEVFNSGALSQKQRFWKALIVCVPASILIGIIYGHIQYSFLSFGFSIGFSIVYIGIGYGIGWLVQTVGRGVQVRFSILGAVCTFIAFLLAEICSVGGIQNIFNIQMTFTVISYLFTNLFNPNVFLGFLFEAIGIYVAFMNSRFVR